MSIGPGSFFANKADYWKSIEQMQQLGAARSGTANFMGSETAAAANGTGTGFGAIVEGSNGMRWGRPPPPQTSAAAAVAAGYLPPPSIPSLVDGRAFSAPSAAQASYAPDLLGEQGGSMGNPQIMQARDLTAAITAANPASVAPESMGLSNMQNLQQTGATATEQAPDVGMAAAALERDKQFPDKMSVDAAEAASIAASNKLVELAQKGGMIAEAVASAGRPSQGPAKRRRGAGGRFAAAVAGGVGGSVPIAAVPSLDNAAQPGGGREGGSTLATSLFRS